MRDPVRRSRPPSRCALCDRDVPLTQHHLIPKRLHRNEKLRRTLGVEVMRHRIAWLCLPCHKHVHRCFSERELGLHFAEIDALRAHPEIRSFVDWLRTKPDDFQPRLSRKKREI